jgi:hypothetical protein
MHWFILTVTFKPDSNFKDEPQDFRYMVKAKDILEAMVEAKSHFPEGDKLEGVSIYSCDSFLDDGRPQVFSL